MLTPFNNVLCRPLIRNLLNAVLIRAQREWNDHSNGPKPEIIRSKHPGASFAIFEECEWRDSAENGHMASAKAKANDDVKKQHVWRSARICARSMLRPGSVQ